MWPPQKYPDVESAWNPWEDERVPRSTKKESKIETALVAAVRRAGGIAYKFSSPARRSVPDRLCLFPGGRVVFVECKRPGGRTTKAQEKEHVKLRILGYQVDVIDFEVARATIVSGLVIWERKT